MTVLEGVPLAPFSSFGVGGPARFLVEASADGDLQEAAAFARARELPLALLGGGTNVLIPDEGVDVVVVRFVRDAYSFAPAARDTVMLVADAATRFDVLVDAAASRELWGIENLAGIPGSSGGALVQNIGAYGTELSGVFRFADVFDLSSGTFRRLDHADVALGYRTSIFKSRPDLAIVRVGLELSRTGEANFSYADLARAKSEGIALWTPAEVARAVRAIRSAKFPRGGRGTAGSFFKNPVVDSETAGRLSGAYEGLPSYPQPDGFVKVSLAWLFDHALGLSGYRKGPVRLYERQPLVVVADEGAHARDIESLAREIEVRAREALSISLEREVETFAPHARIREVIHT